MSKDTYYKTCDKCGANLDPCETCDCEIPPAAVVIRELLFVAIDITPGDAPCVSVMERNGDVTNIINVIYGDEAIDLYHKLITKQEKEPDKC